MPLLSSEKLIAVYKYIDGELKKNQIFTSPIRAMKLPYISFGFYSYDTKGEYLFNDTIEAWKYGPVIPDLYHDLTHSMGVIKDTPSAPLGEIELNSIDRVLSIYGKKRCFDIVDRMHLTGTPWVAVYVDGANNEIPKQDIIKHYRWLLQVTDASIAVCEGMTDVYRALAKT